MANPDITKPRGYLIVSPWKLTAHGGVNGVIRNLAREMQCTGRALPVIAESSWVHDPKNGHPIGAVPTVAVRLRSPVGERQGFTGTVRSLAVYVLTAPLAMWRVCRILRAYDIGTINVHYPSLSAVTFVLLRKFGLFRGKLVVSFHGSDVGYGATLVGLRATLWRGILHGADAVTAVSHELATEVANASLPDSISVRVIHNGVDLTAFYETTRRAAILANDPVIACVASFDYRKGVDILLNAFAQLHARYPRTRLMLIGESGTEDAKLLALTQQLHLEPCIDWHVNVPHREVCSLLAMADVLVLPSRYEAFGLALLEAGAASLPVVATQVGGVPEIIQNDREGILVPPENVQALLTSMVRVLTDRDRARDMGVNLHSVVVNRFTWRACCNGYLATAGVH